MGGEATTNRGGRQRGEARPSLSAADLDGRRRIERGRRLGCGISVPPFFASSFSSVDFSSMRFSTKLPDVPTPPTQERAIR
uniref:Uncharacterized protein n=1 Tax=Oryza barthii TaxID=65489 RepID=A0A0D3HTG0_9ORYZ